MLNRYVKRCSTVTLPEGRASQNPHETSLHTCEDGGHAAKDVEKREHLCPVVGMGTGMATVGNTMERPRKIKNRNAIGPSNPASGYPSEGNEIRTSKRCQQRPRYGNNLRVHQRMNGWRCGVCLFIQPGERRTDTLPFVTTQMDLMGIG